MRESSFKKRSFGGPRLLKRADKPRHYTHPPMDRGQGQSLSLTLERSRFLAGLPGESFVQLLHQVIALLVEIKTRISECNSVPLFSFKSRRVT